MVQRIRETVFEGEMKRVVSRIKVEKACKLQARRRGVVDGCVVGY